MKHRNILLVGMNFDFGMGKIPDEIEKFYLSVLRSHLQEADLTKQEQIQAVAQILYRNMSKIIKKE